MKVEQLNKIDQYNMSIGGVDHMDHIYWCIWLNYAQRNGGGHLFDVVDVAVNIAYQIYHQPHLNLGECRLDVLSFYRAIVDVQKEFAIPNTIHT